MPWWWPQAISSFEDFRRSEIDANPSVDFEIAEEPLSKLGESYYVFLGLFFLKSTRKADRKMSWRLSRKAGFLQNCHDLPHFVRHFSGWFDVTPSSQGPLHHRKFRVLQQASARRNVAMVDRNNGFDFNLKVAVCKVTSSKELILKSLSFFCFIQIYFTRL